MNVSRALFFAVSGQTCSGRQSLYNGLRHELPKRFPEIEFEFIGKPFKDLEHPLLCNDSEQKFPTAKLLHRWGDLEQFIKHKKLERLVKDDRKVVISHGFGLDAVLYATACATCTGENDEAFLMHDLLVIERLKLHRITPPTYLITQAEPATTMRRMLEKYHSLKNVKSEALMEFITYEDETIKRYAGLKGQRLEFIESNSNVASLVGRGVSLISAHIHQRNLHVA